MTRLQGLILEILDRENWWMFGLEIIEKSEKKLELASIFVPLRRLEEQNLVASRHIESLHPHTQRYQSRVQYQITAEGRRMRTR